MPAPALPADEEIRLEKLRTLKILDTASEERFDRLTRMAKKMFGVDTSVVSLVDEGRQWFKSRATDRDLGEETTRDTSFCGHTILNEDVMIIEDAMLDERVSDNPLVCGDPSIRFYAGYPLKFAGGSALGTLCIFDSEPRTFSLDDEQLLRDLGAMAEQEITALQLATLDDLTLISNRRGFLELAQHGLNVCKRKGLSASVLLIDLDKFKPINDKYGHAEGDRALLAFAATMREVFRESDVYGRIGGDEFAVLLMDANENETRESIERFKSAVAAYNAQARRGYDIECSIGCVTAQLPEESDIHTLLDRADKEMYKLKTDSRL